MYVQVQAVFLYILVSIAALDEHNFGRLYYDKGAQIA